MRQRLEKEDNDANGLCEKHDSYELKWTDGNNTQEFKNKCKEWRRESFAFHNTEGVRQRLEKEDNDENYLCKKHDTYELK